MLFRSLLKNAVEAPPKGPVSVSITNGPVPQVTIRNQGVVPDSVRDRFFEKYVTAGKTRGTGLGTYAAKLVADAHGWDIDFSSSEEDGTTVWVTMRLRPARSSDTAVRSATV
jgi:signal transduction histidine kinase